MFRPSAHAPQVVLSLRDLEEFGHLTMPKIRSLKVRPYPFSKTNPWCITGLRNENGKRARVFFKTKSNAIAESVQGDRQGQGGR
jgi:hypothetical protein